ncbi:extracellular solute-binding protein [Klugiella xanthotipulae]|uniref:Carbohydrate ABC transporter substrate-binding protein (CUT1 family) n=1 Tax=Klugiella xanthotipulae TaxID=244735 RepID=A0A543I565_9MICO|nr:extracellular solute-binding protein [Klugiella xanthotipulae]TQM65691.1 carbohydrate ABC transporter substrate-binding protein (CUT1 family) [Klugiella xanthotipulae]
MKKKLGALALITASALALTSCAGNGGGASQLPDSDPESKNITLWLMGPDTPDTLREYLTDEYKKATGGKLTIEQQDWGDVVAKLTTSLPDEKNTPDVVEIGNTQSPTFTTAGAFTDLTDMYDELGGENLLQSFVEAGAVDGKNYALPYYFGSRYNFYRKDIWAAQGKTVPTTLEEFNATVAELRTDDMSGFYLGGSDWRNAISWVFANGGELAVQKDGEWESTLSDPKTIEGLTQFQELFKNASNAPATEYDSAPWVNLNNNDATGKPEAATIIAPGWAHWSIGDPVTVKDPETGEDKPGAEWNDETFGTFVLPGVDGGAAPVFAGGSNIAISAASTKQEAAKELMRIIFSPEYQKMLGESGMGPANMEYTDSLGDDQFAQALVESAANSKLTPAAPGWSAIEGKKILEEFYGKIAAGGDVIELAKEYDAKITPLLNSN